MAKKLVQNDKALFFILSMLFAVGQLAVALLLFLVGDTTPFFYVPLTVLGMGSLLLTELCWDRRAVRIAIRTVWLVLLSALFLFFLVGMFIDLVIRSGDPTIKVSETLLPYLVLQCLYLPAVLLFLFPSAILAARRGEQRIDIRLLRTYACLLTVLTGIGMLAIPDQIVPSFSWLGIDGFYLRLFYFILTCTSLVAAFATYPVGGKRLERLVKRTREKLKLEPPRDEEPAEAPVEKP